MLEVKHLIEALLPDVEALFDTSPERTAARCGGPLACEIGAAAIEGFPFAQGAKVGHDSMVGVEAFFASCGFAVTRQPSPTRVVMRRDL